MDLATRVNDFVNSLGDFSKPEHHPSWATGQIFNSLLQAAKQALPDDDMIRQIAFATQSNAVIGSDKAEMDVGTMKAVMTQVLSALGQTGPTYEVG
jgi:hypothetical protein